MDIKRAYSCPKGYFGGLIFGEVYYQGKFREGL